MELHEAIGTRLTTSTDITTLVSASRITHGDRPAGGAPCINFFEVGCIPLVDGIIESSRYQISCRAGTPGSAQTIARQVMYLFHNLKNVVGDFDFQMGTVEDKFLVKEPDTGLWHVPIDIRFVHNNSTVS